MKTYHNYKKDEYNFTKGTSVMEILKFIFLICIFSISTFIGISISKKYSLREKELIDLRRAMQIFEEKIKFTYEPIPDVFYYISECINNNIGEIFFEASNNMQVMSSSEAWEKACDISKNSLTNDDVVMIKGLAKMLGKTDLDGQVSEIRLMKKFIDTKIDDAKIEKTKNSKLYKTLGLTFGLGIIIVLI